jgi:putative YhdH/YhfP family quinone oxidoreductase
MTFRAFRLTETNGAIHARFVDCTLDDLDPGDVVVRVAFSDVNYKDALAATGTGRILRRTSCIGGIDFAGTVESSADPRFSPGDAVLATGHDLGVSHHGGYAEYARVPGDWLVPLPPGLSLWEAMACGTAGFTAALAVIRMERNGLTPASGPVIVSGATGGVGSMAVAALARLGYGVTALTGKAAEAAYLRTLGAADVLLRRDLDLTRIKPLGRATWAGAVDNLGGDVLAWMASTMKVNGVVASIGLAQSADLAKAHMKYMRNCMRNIS